jgi:outer membrane protein OmpA-like peptidoglycan-associated protein
MKKMLFLTFLVAALFWSVEILTIQGCSKKLVKSDPTAYDNEKYAVEKEAPMLIEKPVVKEKAPRQEVKSFTHGVFFVYFDFNKYDLRPDAVQELERIWEGIENQSVLIEGHCDERGTDAYNDDLGEKRAEAVKAWLSGKSVPIEQIEGKSFGKRNLAIKHCVDDNCHAKNRRAVIRIR